MTNEQTTEEKKKGKGKIIFTLILTVLLIIGAYIGFRFYQHSTNYFVTENARVTTNLISIMPSVPGILSGYSITEGQYVKENEIIGYVDHLETFRSPFNGYVVRSYAIQNQVVLPTETLAVIADTNNLHIQANIEETYITKIHIGQRVIVTIDAFGNHEFSGYVSEIGRVTDAEITGNALFFNTGGTFTKVVQLIPVKINITDNIKLENYIGLNAKVKIDLTSTVSETAHRFETSENNATASRNVYTTLGQIIKRIDVKVGDTVREGQILCVFDADDLAYEVNIAEASLRAAEINLAMAEHNHEIRRTLYATGAVPRDEMRQLEFALQSAIASRQQAQSMLNVARLALDRSIIRSPINGTVTAIFAREGAIGLGLLFVIEEGTSN